MFLPNSYNYPTFSNRQTPSLDLRSLTQLDTRLAQCQNCFAILPRLQRNQHNQIFCPTCGIQYIVNSPTPGKVIQAYFRDNNLYVNDNDLDIEQLKKLGAIAQHLDKNPTDSRIQGLFEAIHLAKKFIHFTTFGLNHQFLGALKLTAQRIPVRGIVSLTAKENYLISELCNYRNEAPKLAVKPLCETEFNWNTMPHQKLIVIDGLLAFKGSANLTLTAWRKATKGLEEIEVVTDLEQVIALNNRYFSSVWANLNFDEDTIIIDDNLINDQVA